MQTSADPKNSLGSAFLENKYRFTRDITVGGRSWRFEAFPFSHDWDRQILAAGFLYGVLGILLTLVLYFLLKINSNHQRYLVDRYARSKEAQQRLSRFIDFAPDAIIVTDMLGKFLEVNRQAEVLSGYTKEELLGCNYAELKFVGPKDLFRLAKGVIELARGKAFGPENFRCRRKDGTFFWAGLHSHPLEVDSEKRVVAIVRDISAERALHEEITKSRENFQHLIRSNPSAILVMDDKTRIQFVNPEAVKLFHGRLKVGDAWSGPTVTGETLEMEIPSPEGEPGAAEMNLTETLWEGRPAYMATIWDVTQRKKEEAELRRLNYAVSQSSSIVMITGKTGTIQYVNHRFTQVTGYSAEEVLGKNPSMLKSGNTPEDVYEKMWTVLSSNQTWRGEFQNKRKNGTFYWVSATISPIRDGQGNLENFMAVQEDITEQKKAAKEISAVAERLRLALSASKVGTWDWDMLEDWIILDDAAYQLLGQTPETFGGRFADLKELVYEPDVEMFQKDVQEAIEQDKDYQAQFRLILADSKIRHVEARGRVYSNSKGVPARMVGVCVDITQKVQQLEMISRDARQARLMQKVTDLTTEEKKADALLRKTLALICADMQWPIGHIYLIDETNPNKMLPSRLWYFSDEKKYAEFRRVSEETNFNRGIGLPGRILATGKAAAIKNVQKDSNFTRAQICKDMDIKGSFGFPLVFQGKVKAVLEFFTEKEMMMDDQLLGMMSNVGGQVSYMIELIRAENEKESVKDQFIQAQKMEAIGNLAGGIAHDFNNYLSVIMGYTELNIGKAEKGSKLRRQLNEILSAARRSANLTQQLLTFSRKQVIRPIALDLRDAISNLTKMLERLLGEDIELVLDFHGDVPAVKMDIGQVDQILVNLAVNARDAMPDGGKLTIECRMRLLDETFAKENVGSQPGEYVMMSVTDTGTGIEPEVLTHIFEPFFTTKEKDKGTGLGLPTCYGIVKQNNGYILVDSVVGRGTSVKIYFPATHEAAETLQTPEYSEALPEGSEKILLVEDEEPLRRLFSMALRDQGYTVIDAFDGVDALEKVRENQGVPFDLIISDVIMPRMSGGELYKEMKKVSPKTQTLFVSGYMDDMVEKQGISPNQFNFMQKPISVEALIRKVREMMKP